MSEQIVSKNVLLALHRNIYQTEEVENRLESIERNQICNLLQKSRFEELSKEELEFIEGRISDAKSHRAEDIIESVRKKNINIVTWYDSEYPLHYIDNAPPVLFLNGKMPDPIKHPYIAIVGARKATAYGREMTETIVKGLAPYGVTIVSGLAYGIDSFAHQAALKAGLPTVAVMGCGIDIIYPMANKSLAEQIIKTGAILSEFPMGTPPLRFNFPIRNRIISGISKGVVVVEAMLLSGSLITARWAAEQGIEVFAVPGMVGRAMSEGTNQLIKDGAHLIEKGEDIANVLGLEKAVTIQDLKKNPGQAADDNDIRETLNKLLKSSGNNLDFLVEQTGLKVNELLPLVTEVELLNK